MSYNEIDKFVFPESTCVNKFNLQLLEKVLEDRFVSMYVFTYCGNTGLSKLNTYNLECQH